jgi:hypothetical protein
MSHEAEDTSIEFRRFDHIGNPKAEMGNRSPSECPRNLT